MLKLLRLSFLPLWLLCITTGFSQTFSFTGTVSIPDSNREIGVPIVVQGLPTATSSSFGLSSVCFTIFHTYDGDLTITLVAPNGVRIPLVTRTGGSGDNFLGTCLSMDGVSLITNGTAPFSSVYRPAGDLNLANSGLNPNGTWQLRLIDGFRGDTGSLQGFSITFGQDPPVGPPPPPAPCSFANMGACKCPDGSDTCDLLPDMTASSVIMAQRTEYVGRVTVSNGTPNIGYGPLEIHGTGQCYCDTVPVACGSPCPSGIKEKVEQTIYRKMGNTYTSYTRPAGYMAYHPTHGHVHMEGWSEFTLRERTSDPNPLNWPVLGTGHKVSYCLVNLSECTAANAYCINSRGQVMDKDTMPNSGLGSVSGCGRDQGIWPGKVDIYGQGLDGQEVPLTNICNGTYYLVSQTDPFNNVLEINDDNNVAVSQITLTQQPAPTPIQFTMRVIGGFQIAAAANIPSGTRFTWDFGDGSTDTSNAIVLHDYAAAGSYTVRLTIHNRCGDVYFERSTMVTASKTLLTPEEFNLSAEPNPTESGSFVLNCRKPTAGAATVTLQDLAGRVVRTLTLEGSAGKVKKSVDVSSLPAGMYLMQLQTEVGAASTRLVIR